MVPLSYEALERDRVPFDEAVARTASIDRFCSSAAWILAAREALMPPAEPWIFRDAGHYVVLARGTLPDGSGYLQPLEAIWELACPLIGAAPRRSAELLDRMLRSRLDRWRVALVGGLPRRTALFREIVDGPRRWPLRIGRSVLRSRAVLDGGVERFLARRSRGFRRNLERSRRRARSAGVAFERHVVGSSADAGSLYARVQAVEARSWKGRQGVGIQAGPPRRFYARIFGLLEATGRLQVVLARHAGQDVGYLFGARFGDTFRALQCSYDAELARFGVGHLLQLETIEHLADGGTVRVYDLGTEVPYKRHWTDDRMETSTVVLLNPD